MLSNSAPSSANIEYIFSLCLEEIEVRGEYKSAAFLSHQLLYTEYWANQLSLCLELSFCSSVRNFLSCWESVDNSKLIIYTKLLYHILKALWRHGAVLLQIHSYKLVQKPLSYVWWKNVYIKPTWRRYVKWNDAANCFRY